MFKQFGQMQNHHIISNKILVWRSVSQNSGEKIAKLPSYKKTDKVSLLQCHLFPHKHSLSLFPRIPSFSLYQAHIHTLMYTLSFTHSFLTFIPSSSLFHTDTLTTTLSLSLLHTHSHAHTHTHSVTLYLSIYLHSSSSNLHSGKWSSGSHDNCKPK